MNRIPLLLCVLVLLIFVIVPHAGQAAVPDAVPYRAGEVLVKLQAGISLSSEARPVGVPLTATSEASHLNTLLRMLGAYHADPIDATSNTYRVSLNTTVDAARLAVQIAADPAVVFAEPNAIRKVMRTPNDPAVPQQWALNNIQAFDAWNVTTGAELVIAVLDTGVSANHPDLDGKILPGYNAINGGDSSDDNNGHGTAVSGLIAANTDNDTGIAGMCWGCRILPVKVLSARGGGDDASVARGLRWAVDNGARIVNMSLGGSQDSQTLRDAVQYAHSRGTLIVAASGNERQAGNPVSYPAAYPEVFAVGATGNTDAITGFSNTGDYVALAAPGVGLWTTVLGGTYGPPNGTSFSSPYVAGVAGLIWTLRSDISNYDVACILQASADDKGAPGKDPEYGWGRLNALRAVQLAQNYGSCPLEQTAVEPDPTDPTDPTPVDPTPGNAPPAFVPVPPIPDTPDQRYFPETGHTLRGEFKRYWQRHGGLPIFGYPTSEEFLERGSDGRDYVVQYFERHRFEFHPENPAPYNVQLSRLGDLVLHSQGRDWFTFPRSGPQSGCLFFEGTGHSVCEPFLSYWRSNGLEFDGQPGKTFEESLALFGQPLSPAQVEEVAPGVFVTSQWFERARLEDHGANRVLLGLLSNELTRARGWR